MAKNINILSALPIVARGIAFPEDRSINPAVCHYIPRDQGDLTRPAGVSYQLIDELIKRDLAELSEYNGFVMVLFTFRGRKAYLLDRGDDLVAWRERHKEYMCCDGDIIPDACVCLVRTWCEVHGAQCHGSHD